MGPQLDVTWDPNKARRNLAKHRVSFAHGASVLLDPHALTVFDETHSEDEERWFTLGLANDGALLAVSHTYRVTGPDSAQVRVISARTATRRERDQYHASR
ncbi:MAG: BrnT family toxin [Rudaea sp.]|uniref:BrnT family toxin n=1 Tax=Rudaea sp. TaxID=2136325 RepID=UPI0039E236CF